MTGSAPNEIIQSATQPTDELHQNVGRSLKQLGHHGSTVPAAETPVLSEDVREWAEDMTHAAKTALEEAVTGGVTHVRVTKSKKPLSIAAIRQALKKAA